MGIKKMHKMTIQELCDLINLLEKWNTEYAFCKPHYQLTDKLILWIRNIIKGKVKRKED